MDMIGIVEDVRFTTLKIVVYANHPAI